MNTLNLKEGFASLLTENKISEMMNKLVFTKVILKRNLCQRIY